MKTVGKYRILGLLGQGGMGRVYRALLPGANKVVAVKALDPDETLRAIVGMSEISRQFAREIEFLGSLRHRHIASVLDVDEDARGRPFYVMEYYCNNVGVLIGETYLSEAPSRMLPVDAAVRYAEQALAGLGRLHAAGVLHRDMKPYNLMVTDEDAVKIIDLGLSRLRGERLEGHPSIKIGTPYYTAPEQEDDPNAADERADLFSVGVMLWRMLLGLLPPERHDEYRRPSTLLPHLGEGFDEFLFRARHPDPERRFPSARAMREELIAVHRDWKRSLDAACLTDAAALAAPREPRPGRPLRAAPLKVSPRNARSVFPVDELYRPLTYYERELIPARDTVLDPATGLTWERCGTEYPVTFPEAIRHLARRNREAFAGHADWRLPTVEELLSIMEPAASAESYCLNRAFDCGGRWLWSVDRKSHTAVWYADLLLAFVWWQDTTCAFHARLVRGPQAAPA